MMARNSTETRDHDPRSAIHTIRAAPAQFTRQTRRVSRRVARALRSATHVAPLDRSEADLTRDRDRAKAHDRAVWRQVAARVAARFPEPSPEETATRLRESGLFDGDWYQCRYGHLLRIGVDPMDHYLRVGHHRGCAPGPHVDLDEVRERLGTGNQEPLGRLLQVRAEVDVAAIQATLRAARPPVTPLDDVELRWRDLIEDRVAASHSFVLYRILGNDLPPRHQRGQSERNLRFLLDHEPELEGCEKRYVVNRIVDPEVERRLLTLLEEHDAAYLRLPFDEATYRTIGWRVSDFGRPGVLYGAPFERLAPISRMRAIDHSLHDKNRYVMNNNGARNVALDDGRSRARWVLPFDGNCFFTRLGWARFRAEVLAAPHRRYVLVPMARMTDNSDLLHERHPTVATEEPQAAFRADADETFDEDRRYGRRPKVELFRRLAVPGPWNEWPDEPWEPSMGASSTDAGEYHLGGWVARLASGEPELEADDRQRMLSRMSGVNKLLGQLDERLVRETYPVGEPLWTSRSLLEDQGRVGTVVGHPVAALIDAEPLRRPDPTDPIAVTCRVVVAQTLAGWLQASEDHLRQAAKGLEMVVASTGRQLDPWQVAPLLDAARLLARTDTLDHEVREQVADWVRTRRDWLHDSPSGHRRRQALGAPGTWHEIDLASCQAYLADLAGLLECLPRVAARFHDRFDPIGRHAGRRTTSRIPDPDELQAWDRWTRLERRFGIRLVDPASAAEEGYARAVATAAAHTEDDDVRGLLTLQLPRSHHSPRHGQALNLPTRPVRLATVPPLWWAGTLPPDPPEPGGGSPRTG